MDLDKMLNGIVEAQQECEHTKERVIARTNLGDISICVYCSRVTVPHMAMVIAREGALTMTDRLRLKELSDLGRALHDRRDATFAAEPIDWSKAPLAKVYPRLDDYSARVRALSLLAKPNTDPEDTQS